MQQKFLEALEVKMGVVSQASKLCGIPRSTHYKWMTEDPEYRKKAEELKDVALDFAENQLFVGMQEKNMTAIIFYLKTQGKNRGYVERTEQHVGFTDLPPIQLTDEQLDQLSESEI